jgi:hypothetical protein
LIIKSNKFYLNFKENVTTFAQNYNQIIYACSNDTSFLSYIYIAQARVSRTWWLFPIYLCFVAIIQDNIVRASFLE